METEDETFPKYVVRANSTGSGFFVFVVAYSLVSCLLVFPVLRWSRRLEEKKRKDIDASNNEKHREAEEKPDGAVCLPNVPKDNSSTTSYNQASAEPGRKQMDKASRQHAICEGGNGQGVLLRLAAAGYPGPDPDFKPRPSNSAVHPTARSSRPPSKLSNGRSSAIASAATTSKLRLSQSSKRPPSGIFDVGGRRWKHRRPIGRTDVIRNAIQSETGSFVSGKVNQAPPGPKRASKGMSDVASSILEDENLGNHPGFINRPGFNHQRLRLGGYSVASSRSVVSSIVDDISPNDAPDADDPGLGNLFLQEDIQIPKEQYQVHKPLHENENQTGWFYSVVDLARPTDESRRVVKTALPLTIGATSEAAFRLVTASFICQYLGSQSMVAYLLVGLFVRLTSEELSGAIIDALSSFLEALYFSTESNGTYFSGQYIQVAIFLQLILGIPLLVLWALVMNPVVNWLVQSHTVAAIAEEYTRIASIGYILQSISRTFTAVFHICGHEHFESVIDFVTSMLQMVAVACAVALDDSTDMKTVAYIQVLVGFSACVAKMGFPIFKGWEKPFRSGILGNFSFIQNPAAVYNLLRATTPLLLGTILEYGEWEVLTIVLRYLGPAEVATWCLLGALWDVLEAFTEGLGEASAIQVAFLLAAGQAERARKLSNTVLYLGLLQSLLVTSVSWSLIGAQGRFRVATSVMFFCRWLVTLPMACVCIFVLFLDLHSISGCLVVGYATASSILTFILLRSDWERIGRLMEEINYPTETPELEFDFDDDDDSSDDAGFGGLEEDCGDSEGDHTH
eukprot:scaffold6433_cov125-Cylindrotheca_fusiformis.AAC.11